MNEEWAEKRGKRKQTKTGIKFLRNVLRVLRSIIGPEARGELG